MKPEDLAKSIFLGSVGLVTASTAILSIITGYGTILSQFIVLGAWTILATATNGAFADQHHTYLWSVATTLNVILFTVPASTIYWLLRHRAPRVCVTVIAAWFLFYVVCLFFMLPATDGP